MSKALSFDLRIRVLAAVQAGASHREAGERFGVSAASVSRWRTREREQGEARPKALGGDRRSKRIEACHDAVMAALGPDKDATIEEVRQALGAQGLVFGFGTIQRFFIRHAVTRKKRQRTLPSRIVPMSQSVANLGSRGNSISTPSA
jgi:transposase